MRGVEMEEVGEDDDVEAYPRGKIVFFCTCCIEKSKNKEIKGAQKKKAILISESCI
jgi:hypothetical protein